MRKKTIKFTADTIFWYVIYFLPVLSYLLFCFTEPVNVAQTGVITGFNTYITTAFNFTENTFIYSILADIFGSNGVFNLGLDNALILCLSWFIGTFIIHLAVDFVLFIPRLCHKWLKDFTQGD